MATRRGRPTQAEAEQLDLAVREAAVATFLEMGYAGAGMEAIARAAGITKRSLYARYPDKRAVFADVLPWALARYTDDGSIDEAHSYRRRALDGAECAVCGLLVDRSRYGGSAFSAST
jgi:TetR/AcrR family transcriptional regulator, mexJK operon transcriptional repressor